MKIVPKSTLPAKPSEETLPKSSLRLYTQKARHDILTGDKERELARRIQQGDKNAWEELVRGNLRLVISLAQKYSRNRDDLFQDLIQSGNIGLMRAAKMFDPERGTRFSTYATFFIQGEIFDELCKLDTIKIPEGVWAALKKIRDFERRHTRQHGRSPSEKQIAEGVAMDIQFVRELMLFKQPISFDQKFDEKGVTLLSFIPDDSLERSDAEKRTEQEAVDCVRRLFEFLTDSEKNIIKRFYGMNGHEPATIKQIAEELGKTAGFVEKEITMATRKMRNKGTQQRLLV